jgi:hypothetical protein
MRTWVDDSRDLFDDVAPLSDVETLLRDLVERLPPAACAELGRLLIASAA